MRSERDFRVRSTVVGVDVGASGKGFHAVALRGAAVIDRMRTGDAAEILRWCRGHEATAIGIDAPCRWRTGSMRAAERDLARARISAYATPSFDTACLNPFYGWMLNGAALYQALEPEFPLLTQDTVPKRVSFETFPHAVACALAGSIVSAKKKNAVRRGLLGSLGLGASELPNIDYVDAALCAVTAQFLVAGLYKKYGDGRSGFIIVPNQRS